MNLALWLRRTALARPGQCAIALGKQPCRNYASLADVAACMAGSLTGRLALRPGDRVALLMGNCREYLECFYAALWAGCALVPVNAKLHPLEARFILENCGARLAFVTPDWGAGAAQALSGMDHAPVVIEVGTADYRGLATGDPAPPAPVESAALAWLFYTSGTTGRPKGAMLSHANLRAMTQGYFTDVDAIAPGEAIVHAAPMSHGSGLYNFAHVLAGAVNVIPESGGFDAEEVLSLLPHHRGASMFAAPTIVKRLVDAADSSSPDIANLKTIVYGGGPMYVTDILRALRVLGPRFVQIYGQGESPMTITVLAKSHLNDTKHPRYHERIGSVGVAQSAVEVTLRDEEDREVPAGEAGEVCVRGEVVMSGYWNNPQASAGALRGGWLRTGDLGVFDDDGFLTLKDRAKDLIISGGSNIYPREVEEVLLTHPGVAEASVVGRADAEWGEVAVAFIVARGGQPSTAELDRYCLASIARFKRPKEYHFVEALPKNNYGKVLKTELRARLEQLRRS